MDKIISLKTITTRSKISKATLPDRKNSDIQKNVENKDASTQFLDDDPELPINTSTNPTNRLSVMNSSKSANEETFEGDVAENTLRVSLQNSDSYIRTSELPNLFFNSLNFRTKAVKEDNSNNEVNIVKEHFRLENNNSILKTPKTIIDVPVISPQYFYSKTSPTIKKSPAINQYNCVKIVNRRSNNSSKSRSFSLINKGVSHKIRPKSKVSQRKISNQSFLKSLTNEKLKNITSKLLSKENDDINSHQFESNQNITKAAQPLIVKPTSDDPINCMFSDDDESNDLLLSEIGLPNLESESIENTPPKPNKKFFKNGRRSTRKEIQIVNNIRGTYCDGKISILKHKMQSKKSRPSKNVFCAEQAAVDNIINKLDDISMSPNKSPISISLETYENFRKRIPYNTDIKEKIEEQHLLLDFLITNNICTEQNFDIFIVDPDNHKKEAESIVNNLTKVTDNINASNKYDEYMSRISGNATDAIVLKRQKRLLSILIDNDICNEENFKYFVLNYEERQEECDKICDQFNDANESPSKNVEPSTSNDKNKKLFPIFYTNRCHPLIQKSNRRQRTFYRGKGIDQRQIDAGQKSYGPKQCTQCGLVYTQHEAEEEKIHDEYHQSLHVLKFKGWILEDIVAYYSEWGTLGRIMRIDETSNVKRKERLMDVLKIVDKELGFSSYILPKNYVAFFAIRNKRIIGLCLVQPLDKANKYVCVNGVDCCTNETFEARCGISRIWVSPFDRRMHIASKLIEAVQSKTFEGQTIPLDKIAFSAPTEDGKFFAKKVSGQENFLVYQ